MKTLNVFLLFFCTFMYFVCDNIRRERNEAVETACALSDIVRMHMDNSSCSIKEDVDFYLKDDSIMSSFKTIDSINWAKYSWCY